jgi:TFIIF-interacting CTD phosphatase-like protein
MKPTKEYFEGFQWSPDGAMRKDITDWLRKTSGYTSNRAIDKIINAALQEKIIKKCLNTRRYYPVG